MVKSWYFDRGVIALEVSKCSTAQLDNAEDILFQRQCDVST